MGTKSKRWDWSDKAFEYLVDYKRVRERLVEGVDVMESIERLDHITSREYGWMRDWLAAAKAALSDTDKRWRDHQKQRGPYVLRRDR